MSRRVYLSFAEKDRGKMANVFKALEKKGLFTTITGEKSPTISVKEIEGKPGSVELTTGSSDPIEVQIRPLLTGLPTIKFPKGVRVVGPQRVKASEDIRTKLHEDIQEASGVVVYWTEAAAKSEWVNYEAGMAEALGKGIVVVRDKGNKVRLPAALQHVKIVDIEGV